MGVMLLRLLIIGALVYLVWRWLTKKYLLRAAHDPSPKAPDAIREPYEVLGIGLDASPEAIRAAYQAKISQYHPDKVAGLGPELQDLAEQHTKEINIAYEKLRKPRRG